MPRDQVQGRMHKIDSGISVEYGLLLSGVAASGLQHISVDEFAKEPDKLALANFANVAASLQLILCLSGSVFTTFDCSHIPSGAQKAQRLCISS